MLDASLSHLLSHGVHQLVLLTLSLNTSTSQLLFPTSIAHFKYLHLLLPRLCVDSNGILTSLPASTQHPLPLETAWSLKNCPTTQKEKFRLPQITWLTPFLPFTCQITLSKMVLHCHYPPSLPFPTLFFLTAVITTSDCSIYLYACLLCI